MLESSIGLSGDVAGGVSSETRSSCCALAGLGLDGDFGGIVAGVRDEGPARGGSRVRAWEDFDGGHGWVWGRTCPDRFYIIISESKSGGFILEFDPRLALAELRFYILCCRLSGRKIMVLDGANVR